MTYQVTAQATTTVNGLRPIFVREVATAKNQKEAVKFFKEVYQPALESQHSLKLKVLGASK